VRLVRQALQRAALPGGIGATRYPFVPKSNRLLTPGQFWAIRLSTGRFGAGRVTVVPAFGPKDRVGFCAAVLDWSGDHEPSAADIAGRRALLQGKTRFDAITKNGSEIIGLRPLAFDPIDPMDPMEMRTGVPVLVMGWLGFVHAAEDALKRSS
jgi:hypothetical protein